MSTATVLTPVLLGSTKQIGAGASMSITPTAVRKRGVFILHYHTARGASVVAPQPTIAGMGLTWRVVARSSNNYDNVGTTRGGAWTYLAVGVPDGTNLVMTHGGTMAATDTAVAGLVYVEGASVDADSGTITPEYLMEVDATTPSPARVVFGPFSYQPLNTSGSPTSPWGDYQGAPRIAASGSYLRMGFYASSVTPATTTPAAGWTQLMLDRDTGGVGSWMYIDYAWAYGPGAGTPTVSTSGVYSAVQVEAYPPEAPRWVGRGTWTRTVGGTSTGSNQTSPTWQDGFSPREGDLALLWVFGNSGGSGANPTVTGWTHLQDSSTAIGGRLSIFAKVLSTAEALSPSFTVPYVSSGSFNATAIAHVFRGVKTSSLPASTAFTSRASGTVHGPQNLITTTIDNTLIIANILAGATVQAFTGNVNDGFAQSVQASGGRFLGIQRRPVRTATTVNASAINGTVGSQSSVANYLLLEPLDRDLIESSIEVGAVEMETTLVASDSGPFVTSDIEVGDVEVQSVVRARSRPYHKPRREVIWLYGIDGERKIALS